MEYHYSQSIRNNPEINYMYEDANKGIRKALDHLYSMENIWNETRTLKLYDAFFKIEDIIKEKFPLLLDEMNWQDWFYGFCEDSYDQFTDWLREEGITDQRQYICRTSSFYLTDLNDSDKSCVLGNLLDLLSKSGYLNSDYCEFDSNLNMEPLTWSHRGEESLLIDAQKEIEYLSTGFTEDIDKVLADAKREAEYIDDFKANQVEYLEEWLSMKNDDAQYAIEQAKERQYKIDLATMPCYI